MATTPRSPITLAQLHNVVGGTLVGSPQASVTSLASFDEAGPNDLTFVTGDRMLKTSGPPRAGALLAHRHLAEMTNPHIVVPNPTLAFAQIARTFFCPAAPPRGIDAAVIRGHDTQIGPDASIWPGVTLGDRVRIGARVTLYPGVFIGNDTTIGDDTLLYPNVVVREGCTIGARVIIHSGTVIGSDGFGYVQDQGRHYKIPQLGGVTIEDDVELGANVTVDRATLGQTLIRQGTKVDNLVQIAHNVHVGEHSAMAGARHSSRDSRSLHRAAVPAAPLRPLWKSRGRSGPLRYVNLFRRSDTYHSSSFDLDSHLHASLMRGKRADGSVTCDAIGPSVFW